MLETLGLDPTTENVYRAILGQPQMSVADLHDHLGISEETLRLALDRLSALALVRPSLHDPQRFRIVDPEVPMRLLLARQEERLAQEHQRIEQTRLAVSKLMVDFAATQSRKNAPGVEQLEGIEEIRERINVLSHSVRTEVMALAPGGAQSAASIEAARPQDAELLRRGVLMRTVYLDSIRNNPLTMQYANWLREQGGQVRTAPSLPIRMTILDREIAVVPTDGENSAAGALVLNGTGALVALTAFFENIWESALPLGNEPNRRDERGLVGQEAEAIRLLGQGLTDEAIAKRLGVSPRTARRIAADLMEKMGARSRFQAGARATAMGWITGTE
ncbi:helix-turn-helix domain-containing protein [Streptomyces sp. NPDC044780]|uniref:Helix-turn-helix domain-containing protein n=1 Tax=Streptomyces luomodiensis TaxID=3026192 RepID=A0ABY9V0S2_9ACTN|nr:helix-turn-helix domain-containing protein [Streptomyces sp. SCA4-21]WNE98363.1 helix-turn-helix domain-containing protein [Streptomyces sp. SCA4-21]